MNALREWHRRLDRLQRRFGVKIALTVLTVAMALAVAIPVHRAASEYGAARQAIVAILSDVSIEEGDPAAVELRSSGTITAGDEVYGGSWVARHGDLLFARSGEVANPAMVAELALAPTRPARIPHFLLDRAATAWTVIALAAAWTVAIVWLSATLPFAIVLAATGLLCLPIWLLKEQPRPMMVAVAGIGLLAFSFVLLIRIALLALSSPTQVVAVAHTTIREATRTGISLGFIAVLLVLLPLIPLWIDDAQPLRYQIQTFISRSVNLTYVIAAAMTLLLGCATVAFEIRDRQIWQLMTKPVSRLAYLLGKFVGIAVLNVILLTICGVSIFTFVQEMRMRPATDPLDAQSVRDEILVARSGTLPVFTALSREQIAARVEQEIRNDPMLRNEIELGDRREIDVWHEIGSRHRSEHLARQRQIAPGEMREYRFEGLSRERAGDAPLTLRFLFHAGQSDPHEGLPVLFIFENHDLAYAREFRPVQGHVLSVPSSVIDDEGVVRLQIWNLGVIPRPEGAAEAAAEDRFFPGPYTIFFDADALEILYRVGSFEWNFARAIFAYWVKLCFLAMLAVCCATFLSFPVACILSFTVFTVGSMGPFIAESLEYWYIDAPWRVDQVAAMYISSAAEWTLRAFGTVSPTDALVQGRVIALGDVARSLVNVGIIWSGVVLFAGWVVFRRRELATYSGHG